MSADKIAEFSRMVWEPADRCFALHSPPYWPRHAGDGAHSAQTTLGDATAVKKNG